VVFELVRITEEGLPATPIAELPRDVAENCAGTAVLLRRTGYALPWVGYVAAADGRAVGGGAFVGPPQNNLVEIAYYTLPEFEGRGYASRTAAELVAIARREQPGIVIRAFTLPAPGASTRILERTGFRWFGDATDPDAGPVWEWRTQEELA